MKQEKILKAIYDTYEHSKELYDDAEFLFNNGKKQRAYTFYHFSFEESGRFFLLSKVLFRYLKGEIEAKDLNYKLLKGLGYEKHIEKLEEATLKMVAFPLYTAIRNGDKRLNKILKNYTIDCRRISANTMIIKITAFTYPS